MFLPLCQLIPIINDALGRGQRVRMTVTGSSMLPFLHGRDMVELESAKTPRLGDIVLVHDATESGERYVLHRIVQVDEKTAFFIQGDAQRHREGPFPSDAVLARVTRAWHHGKVRALISGRWRFAGLLWMRCAPFSVWILRLIVRICDLGKMTLLGLKRVPALRN